MYLFDHIKPNKKGSCRTKDAVNKVNNVIVLEKIFVMQMTDERLISIVYINFVTVGRKKEKSV